MILVLKPDASQEDVEQLVAKLAWMDLQGIALEEEGRRTIAIVNGDDAKTDLKQFAAFPLVETILPLTQKFKLASRELRKQPTVIQIGSVEIGNGTFAVMAGPCSIAVSYTHLTLPTTSRVVM